MQMQNLYFHVCTHACLHYFKSWRRAVVGIIMQVQELHTSKALKKANYDVPISCKEVNSSSLVYDNIILATYNYVYVTNAAMNYINYIIHTLVSYRA